MLRRIIFLKCISKYCVQIFLRNDNNISVLEFLLQIHPLILPTNVSKISNWKKNTDLFFSKLHLKKKK